MSQQPEKARLEDLQPDKAQELAPEEAGAVRGGDGSTTTTKATFHDLTFTHTYDKASPVITSS